ncbi:MAG: hypothetical protein HUK14_01330 [Muribaculaceae bacterium]|nr:hypothetical protein [Muribaculaceae bacterium]
MKFNIETSDRICGNKYFPLVFVALAFLVVLLFSYSTSPIYGIELRDSAVFKMMGHVLLNGGVPYVDYFDHKGPYLYLINAIGESISPHWGLFPIQVVWLSLSFILWYKTAQLFVRPTYSLIITLITIGLFIGPYEYGDLTEEWSLLPTSISVYLAVSFLVNQPSEKHSYWRSLVYGLCFGMVFLIRPNDAIMICGGVMTGIFLYIMFCQKQYANALVNALAFFAGAIIMAAPWIAYFAYHGALENFYFGLIGFNIDYSGGLLYNLKNIFEITKLVIVCIFLIGLVIIAKRKLLWVLIPICIYIILLFGRNNYPHYYMTITPAITLLYVSILFCKNYHNILKEFIAILPLFYFAYSSSGIHRIYYKSIELVTGKIPEQYLGYQRYCDDLQNLLSLIPKEDCDSIWNYSDIYSNGFHLCGIIAQNPVPPVIVWQKRPLPKEMEQRLHITLQKPLWILIDNPPMYLFPEDSAFIAENYHLVKESASAKYILLKRKK